MKYDVSLQTISWINGRRHDGSLEISPKFQRRPVWLDNERSLLIATICSGLPFPEVYIQHVTNPSDGTEKHVVVDGQQRITSILMFIDGLVSLPLNDDFNGESFGDFEETAKADFWNYKVVVRGLSNTNDAEIRDLFTRLNTNNISLNDQELRNARFKGRFKLTAERIADNPLFQNIGLYSARDVRRMIDIEFASELLLLVVFGITNKKDLLEETYAAYEEDFPDEAMYEATVNTALNLVHSIVTPQNQQLVKTKSNFYSIFGACVEYHKDTGRSAFKNADGVAERIANLLTAAKTGEFGEDLDLQEYYDAVTRAASDKGRRAKRHVILLRQIKVAEAQPQLIAPPSEQAQLPFPIDELARKPKKKGIAKKKRSNSDP